MEEIITNIHIHSIYSDGVKTPPEIARDAAKCGVDAIILTDHNVFPQGFNGYYSFGDRKVLLITGEEIHDQNRQPQKNHLLAIGIQKDFSRMARDPQILIDSIKKAGGIAIIAHAYDPALPMFGEDDLSWEDWSVKGFTGLEIWNNLSEFKLRVSKKWQGVLYAFFPQLMALEPPKQIRRIWDDHLNKGERIVAIGGADAHTLRYHVGPFTKSVFPYTYHFRSVNTHVLLDSPLSGDAQVDTQTIVQAIKKGHAFIGYDMIKPARGFRFYLQDHSSVIQMGERTTLNPDALLTVDLPFPSECMLIRNGEVVHERKISNNHSWKVDRPGVYRLECYRNYFGKKRGWIFSNPIYID
jgi:hypothetical protein